MKLNTTRLKRDFKLGIKNLLLHKLRSLLTKLGLVFGDGRVIGDLEVTDTFDTIPDLPETDELVDSHPPQPRSRGIRIDETWINATVVTEHDRIEVEEASGIHIGLGTALDEFGAHILTMAVQDVAHDRDLGEFAHHDGIMPRTRPC